MIDTAKIIRAKLTTYSRLAARKPDQAFALEEMLAGRRLERYVSEALEIALESGGPLATILATRLAKDDSMTLAASVADKINEPRFGHARSLRPVAIASYRKLVDDLESVDDQEPETLEIIASLAHNLGRSLRDLGRLQEAVEPFQRAIELFRALKLEGRLAVSLNNYGALLSLLGRWQEALDVTRKAVHLGRTHADDPEGQLQLADSLVNLSNCLVDRHHRVEALEVIEEAVETYRDLESTLDDFELHRYAIALTCLGNHLGALGQLEDSLLSLEKAVELCSRLASDRETSFAPDLALAFANIAIVFHHLGRHKESRDARNQALDRFRGLSEEFPEAFTDAYAWAQTLSFPLGQATVEEQREALQLTETAVTLHRRLVTPDNPATQLALAKSLDQLSTRLHSLGRFDEALAASEDAIELLEALGPLQTPQLAWAFLSRSRAFLAMGHWKQALRDGQRSVALFQQQPPGDLGLVSALPQARHQLAISLHECGRYAEATDVMVDVVEAFHALAEDRPQVYLEDLGAALTSYSNLLAGAGRLEKAIEISQKAVEVTRSLSSGQSRRFNPDYAVALNALGGKLLKADRYEEARIPLCEAVTLHRSCPEESSLYRDHLADTLHNLGTVLYELEMHREARSYLEQAVALRRELFTEQPEHFAVDLARSLVNLGNLAGKEGSTDEAVESTGEAAALYRNAVRRRGEHLTPELAMTLSNLGNQLRRQGRAEEAVTNAREAVELLTPYFLDHPQELKNWLALAWGAYWRAAEQAGADVDPELFMLAAEHLYETT